MYAENGKKMAKKSCKAQKMQKKAAKNLHAKRSPKRLTEEKKKNVQT